MAAGTSLVQSLGSEIVFDFFCEICNDIDKHVEAEGYCVDCGEYLCGPCSNAHGRTRATRYHVLKDKDHMPRDTPLSTDRIRKDINTKCKLHSAKMVKYFCKSHDVLGCSTCFATGHRGCPDIVSIEDVSENFLENQELKDFVDKLQSTQMKSGNIIERTRENKTESDRYCAEAISAVRRLKEEAVARLNEIENITVSYAYENKIYHEEVLASVEADCTSMTEQLKQIASEVESLRASKRACQLYISMKTLESDIKKLQDNLETSEALTSTKSFRLEPNSELMSFLRSNDVFGKFFHGSHQLNLTDMTKAQATGACIAPFSGTDSVGGSRLKIERVEEKGSTVKTESAVAPSKVKASLVDQIHVRQRNVRNDPYGFSGSAVVSSNKLLLCDSRQLKLVDTEGKEMESITSFSNRPPWDVTVISTNQAAVTLQESNTIILLHVADTLTQQRGIAVGGECYGVAFSQDRFVVTFVDTPHVEIIDLHGKVIRKIENPSDGRKLFERPQHACVSRDGETIYVSDYNRDTVTSLSFDGKVKSVYRDNKLRGPRKVCTDDNGYIYVCGYTSQNVHVLTTAHGKFKKVSVFLTKVSFVSSVSHCQNTNRLFIGGWGKNIKGYQL